MTEPKNEITVFEENLTAEGLALIQIEAAAFPERATDKIQYELVYSQHQRFKRLDLACRNKAKELEKEEKTRSKSYINKIKADLLFVKNILDPVLEQLDTAREIWDGHTEALKMNAARDYAIAQKKEFERQEVIRLAQKKEDDHEQAVEENRLIDVDRTQQLEAEQLEKAAMDIEKAAEKLEREKYEFSCEKSRSGYTKEQAEIDFFRMPYIEQHEINNVLVRAYSMNRELDTNVLSYKAEKAAANNYKDCFSQEELEIELCRLDFDECWDEAHEIEDSIWTEPKNCNETFNRDPEPLPKNWNDEPNPIQDIKNACEETGTDHTEFYNEISNADTIEICKNPEQDYIDLGYDEETEIKIKTVTDFFINELKCSTFVDPKKQQKLNNFILNIEINFNTFLKSVK